MTALPEEEFTIVQLVVSSLAKNGITFFSLETKKEPVWSDGIIL